MERAFRLLKPRWRKLLKQYEQKLNSVARTVTAAIVMHNFCLKLQDFYEPDEVVDNEEPDVNIPLENEVCEEGQDVRNTICDYLVKQGLI